MAKTVLIHFSAGDKSYNVLREGFTFSRLVGAKGKHATQSVSLSIRSREAGLLFLQENDKLIGAEVKEGDTVIFEGVVRPYRNFTAHGKTENPINLEIMDYTEALHTYATEDKAYEGKTVKQILLDFWDLSGLSTELVVPDALGAFVVDYYKLKKGSYYDQLIGDLLYEFGYDFVFGVGSCSIIATDSDAVPTETLYDLRNTLSISRSDDGGDGVRVKYGAYPRKRVTMANHTSQDMGPRPEAPAPFAIDSPLDNRTYYNNSYYAGRVVPDSKWLKWSPSGVTLSDIITIEDVKVFADSNSNHHGELIVPSSVAYDMEGCAPYIWPTGWGWGGVFSGGVVYYLTVSAMVTYRVDDAIEAYTSGESPSVITSKFITRQEHAEAFAKRESKRQIQASLSYSFDSLTDYTIGAFYKLVDTVTGISTTVRVIGSETDANGMRHIRCEGAGAVGSSIPVEVLQLKDIQDEPDEFITIATAATVYPWETVKAEIQGRILTLQSEYAFTYEWSLDGVVVAGESGLSVELDNPGVEGPHTLTVNSYYNGELHATASAVFEVVTAGSGTDIEYAVNNDPENPPLVWDGAVIWSNNRATWDGESAVLRANPWSKESPKPKRGEFVWMRTR